MLQRDSQINYPRPPSNEFVHDSYKFIAYVFLFHIPTVPHMSSLSPDMMKSNF
jgi:hypothetical protein